MNRRLLKTIQEFVAVDSIGVSAMRGQGKGVIRASHEYLRRIKLGRIPTRSEKAFLTWMDRRTEELRQAMPNGRFGTARKALNLFLRAAAYNHFLRREYNLTGIELWMEVPVDSVVARALERSAPGRAGLPRWPGLRHLEKDQHIRYQECAERMARKRRLPARVFLDNYLWLDNR